MTNKISKSLLLLVTITGGLFLFNTGSQAQADSSFANVSYVQANRKIKTNLYRTINGKKSSYYLPKGAKFSVAGVSSTRNAKGTVDYFVSPSLDNYSYRYRSAFTNFKKTNGHITTSEIPFTSKNFTKVNMPYKFSNQYFQYGKAWSFSIKQFHQIFNVTQDGYIQFYSTASLKKSNVPNSFSNWDPKTGRQLPEISAQKPTTTRKITATKKAGSNITYVYYSKPIHGLKEAKVGKNNYRLKINYQKSFDKVEGNLEARWASSYVGGSPYFILFDANSTAD